MKCSPSLENDNDRKEASQNFGRKIGRFFVGKKNSVHSKNAIFVVL